MKKFFNFILVCVSILTFYTCVTIIPKSKNSLACRYRTPDGHLLELPGLNSKGKIKFYPMTKNGNEYLWSCSSTESKCPLFLNNNLSFLPASLLFVVNDSRDEDKRTNFVNDVINSCQKNTPHGNAEFVEYGIKSQSDAQPIFFHKVFFQRTQTNSTIPFGRIVAFGDSLTDNGNVFATTKQTVQWPYFIGRFSNGPVWIENIAQILSEQQKIPIDLYNYAEGGSGTGFVAFNPFSLSKQVDLYLSTMDNTCPEEARGCHNNNWDPAYNKTLFTILAGANDYMYCAALDTKKRNQNCLCDSADDCADAVVNGRTKNGMTLKGIKNNIIEIINHAKEKNAQDAQYFMIPNLPDIANSPYYTRVLSKRHAQTKFVYQASLKHNILLNQAIAEIQKTYPHAKFVNVNLFEFMNNAINDSKFPPIIAARVTNTKDRCFFGNPSDFRYNYCTDPASYLFWDYIHPSMTTHCMIGEYASSQIYSEILNSTYLPKYEHCHNTFINH